MIVVVVVAKKKRATVTLRLKSRVVRGAPPLLGVMLRVCALKGERPARVFVE